MIAVSPGSVTDFSSSSVTSNSSDCSVARKRYRLSSSSVTSSSSDCSVARKRYRLSSSSVTSSSSDCSVAYDSDGEPAMVVNRIAEVGLREAYKYEPTLTDSGAGRGARIRQYWSR